MGRISEHTAQDDMPDLQDIIAGAMSEDAPDLLYSGFATQMKRRHARNSDKAAKIALHAVAIPITFATFAIVGTGYLAVGIAGAPIIMAGKIWRFVRREGHGSD